MKNPKKRRSKKAAEKETSLIGDEIPEHSDAEVDEAALPSVWQPGQDSIAEGESLQYDPTAYDCLHQLTYEWPCLSFDVVRDGLGGPRSAFPHDVLLVAGTQAAAANLNYIALMRLCNLGQGEHAKLAADDDGFDLDDSDVEDDDPPRLHTVKMRHSCGVNRVRGMPQRPGVVAAWGEDGRVGVWDFGPQFTRLAALAGDASGSTSRDQAAPLQSHAHKDEGYALDWSPSAPGRLASGDNKCAIHVWNPQEGARWAVSEPYEGHTGSVEDIQWSPSEASVFVSGSSDCRLCIWDCRDRSKPQISVVAHEADVNVVSWNQLAAHTMASGGDDGRLRVWDLRALTAPVADFKHHRAPVTSVEWCPHESAMLVTTGADNALAVWDLALERDPEEELQLGIAANASAPEGLPAQLLFVHAGQTDMKEAHWHPQIPGLLASTAADGFHVFKPSNIMEG